MSTEAVVVHEEPVKEIWVCVDKGLLLEKGVKGIKFNVVLEDGSRGAEKLYSLKSFRSARIGNIYEIETNGSQCYPSSLRWKDRWKNREDVLEWEARVEARRVEAERKKGLTEAAKSGTLIAEHLEPLRKAYRKLDWTATGAFEALVVHYLRTGRIE